MLFANATDEIRADAASKEAVTFSRTEGADSLLNAEMKLTLTSVAATVELTVGDGIERTTNTDDLVEFHVEVTTPNKALLLGTSNRTKVAWRAAVGVPGSRFVEGQGYEGVFTLRGPAVEGDPFVEALFTSTDGNYLPYYETPYSSGDTDTLKALFDGATDEFLDVAIWGDSQETLPSGSGIWFVTELNRIGFRRYGQATKLPLYRFGAFNPDAMWCIAVQAAGASATDNEYIPGFYGYEGTNGGGTAGPLSVFYPDAGLIPNATDGNYFPADTGSVRWQVLVRGNTSATVTDVRAVHLAGVDPKLIFGTTNTRTEYDSTGLTLNADDDTYSLFTTGQLQYIASQPWHNCYATGLDSGGNTAAGLITVGSRFIDTSRNQGACFTSFSSGGLTTGDHLTGYPSASDLLAPFLADPFEVLLLTIGANDAGNIANTPAVFKGQLNSLFAKAKADFGSNIFVVFVSEPPKEDFGGSTVTKGNFLQYAGAAAELANELSANGERVAFLNLGRKLYDISSRFGDSAADGGAFLNDTVHLGKSGQIMAAEMFFELIDEA